MADRIGIAVGLRLVVMIMAIWSVLPTTGASGQDFVSAVLRREVSRVLRDNGIPGVAIAVVRGGRIFLTEGYGEAYTASPVTSQTQFMTASLSKAFTAAAVLRLVEEGRIDLDMPVTAYLPEFAAADAEASRRITVRHLLNQRSGLSDSGYPEMRRPPVATLTERVAGLREARLVAEPGRDFHYFNGNYAVLALLVERVSGLPFNSYLAERLFVPLGMRSTFTAATSAEVREKAPELAQGHVSLFGVPVRWSEGSGNLAGSGGVVSTAEDMARWIAMLAGGGELDGMRVLSRDSVQTMRKAMPGSTYAMGWFVSSHDGEAVLFHNGILSTFYAEAMLKPDSGLGIVILANVSSLPHVTLAFPRLRDVLIELTLRGEPAPSRWSVRAVGTMSAIVSLVLLICLIRLLRRWKQPVSFVTGRFSSLLSLALRLTPMAILILLPWIIQATSGRAFDFWSVALAMLDVVIPLGIAGMFGIVSAVALAANRTGFR